MGKPVPERLAAKAAGEQFYFTGIPCQNGHVVNRYSSNGLCTKCVSANVKKHRATKPWHPARVAAKEASLTHFQRGRSCRHGHEDKWLVSTDACVGCTPIYRKRYLDQRPGLEAEWARIRRAKDPTGHRAEVKRWARKNPEKHKAFRARWIERNPDLNRARNRAYTAAYRTMKAANGGCFTPDDITDIHRRQKGKCAACRVKLIDFEIDHIKPVILGGSSDPRNLQLLCMPCNRSKGGKDPLHWARDKGRLL